MKTKVTGRELRENYYIQSVGYCDVQYLLSAYSPRYYNYGVYGWNYDVYVDDDYPTVCVCTGYRPIGKNILSHEEIREWDKKGREEHDYEKRKELYHAFFKRLYEENLKQLHRV